MCRYAVRIIPKCCPHVVGISVRMYPKYADEVLEYIGNKFSIDFYKRVRSVGEIKKF
jgi:hypothetical protein